MTDVVDLDTYGQPNDIGPDEPAPREPRGEPAVSTDDFFVWQFESDASDTVQDTYVVARDPSPLDFRMWVFVGQNDVARFALRASHKYGPDEVVAEISDDCCEVLFDGQSLRRKHCPTAVETVVKELTGATLVWPEASTEDSHGGPINY